MESRSDIKELQHLSRCALMLHSTSPSVSTHISRLLLDKCRDATPGSVEHTLAQKFCGTCGCRVLPGITSTMTHNRSKHMRTKHKTIGVATVIRRRKCHHCDRVQTLPSVKKPSRGAMMAAQKSISPQVKSHEESVQAYTTIKETKKTVMPIENDKVNNKSKERKKKRNKGLASLLAAKASSSTTKPSSTGLDLSDFMM